MDNHLISRVMPAENFRNAGVYRLPTISFADAQLNCNSALMETPQHCL